MPNDTHELRAGFPAWGMSTSDAGDDLVARAAWWLSGGAMLLVWTALALLLTS
jgi:hypothetical protein